MLDFLIVCFYRYGLFLLAFLLMIKLIILSIYKPKDKKYILKRLFIYHHQYKVRREDFLRWRKFRIILNTVTIILHLSIGFYIFSRFMYDPFTRLGRNSW